MAPTPLTLAVCLFPLVGATDFQGSIELFTFLSPKRSGSGVFSKPPPFTIEVTYFGVTKDPIEPASGPNFLVNRTYDDLKEGEQFDVIFVPGGAPVLRSERLSCLDLTINMMFGRSRIKP